MMCPDCGAGMKDVYSEDNWSKISTCPKEHQYETVFDPTIGWVVLPRLRIQLPISKPKKFRGDK
jgi:hypothetical protein